MKKILSLLLCLIMVASVFAGCGAAPAASAGSTISAVLGEEPKTIDPTLNAAVDGATYIVQLFEGLTTVDKNLQVVPGMAKTWDVSADGLVYTFHLRDAKWSDGQPVKAGDFVYAWRRAVDPATAAEYSWQMAYVLNAGDITAGKAAVDTLGVKAIDDKTLEVTLQAPCGYFINLTGFPTYFPVREDVVSKDPTGWSTSAATYVCNGPFKLQEWTHDSKIVMVKNDNYWNASTILPKELDFTLNKDSNTILGSFKANQIQYSDIVDPKEIPALQAEGTLKIDPLLGTRYFNFNMSKAPFDNEKVREAITLAIDRNYITEKVCQDGSLPAGAMVPPSLPDAKAGSDFRTTGGDFYSIKPADYDANVAKAKQLLADAGYPDGKGFPAFSYMTNDAGTNIPIAEAIQSQLKDKLGITMNIETVEFAVLQQNRIDGTYETARGGWVGDYVDPMTFLDMFQTGSQLNDPHFTNAQYDQLIKDAKVEQDVTKRFDMMHQAEKILIGDTYACAPTTYYTEPQIVSKSLQGLVHSPLGFKYFMWTTISK